MQMWDNILRGEREYIDPFVDTCEIKLDTFMEYELNLMAGCGLSVIRQLQNSPRYREQGSKLVADLEMFLPISEKNVPENSLIREFIG